MGNFKKSSIQKIQENEGITHNLSMFFEHLQALKTVNSPSKIGTRAPAKFSNKHMDSA